MKYKFGFNSGKIMICLFLIFCISLFVSESYDNHSIFESRAQTSFEYVTILPELPKDNEEVYILVKVTDNYNITEIFIDIEDVGNYSMNYSVLGEYYYFCRYYEAGEYSFTVWASDGTNLNYTSGEFEVHSSEKDFLGYDWFYYSIIVIILVSVVIFFIINKKRKKGKKQRGDKREEEVEVVDKDKAKEGKALEKERLKEKKRLEKERKKHEKKLDKEKKKEEIKSEVTENWEEDEELDDDIE